MRGAKITIMRMLAKKQLKRLITILILSAICLTLLACRKSSKDKITEVTVKKDKLYSCMYGDVEHEFLVCDSTTQIASQKPLVIMLHGYASTAQAFKSMTKFDENANERGYVVCYVTCTSNPDNKLDNGWNSGIGDSDKDDLEFLVSLTGYLQEEYNCDKKKTYVAGFSNGAFMVHRLAQEASDTFSKCVSVAGMMPQKVWDARGEKSDVSFLQIYGTLDDVVPQSLNGSDKTSPHPAIEDVMDYRAKACGIDGFVEQKLSEKTTLTKYEDNTYRVWTVVIEGGRHSWPDELFAGFDVNNLILEFFED